MNVIVSAFALVIGIIFMTISTIAGIIILPIVLLFNALFGTPKRSSEYYLELENIIFPTPDHHIHIPLEKVPPEYYESYKAYLKSPEWRAFRRLVLKRDKYRCVDCNVKGYNVDYNPTGPLLQVHHIHYDGIETMTFTIDQCVSVCPECHDKRHGRH